MKHRKSDVAFIMAGKGFAYIGASNEGYRVYSPYKDYNLLWRVMREIWRKFSLFKQDVWYDKKITNIDPKDIIIYDPLITVEYLEWLIKKHPKARIHFVYRNMVGKARHILPDSIPKEINVWTYDDGDCEKYGIKKYSGYYFPSFCREKKGDSIDVFFIGRDKGRKSKLLQLEKYINNLGLRTKFIITADGRFSMKKKDYDQEIGYDKVCEYLSNTKSVLNIGMENQKGLTLRDYESVFHKVKLITDNKNIVNSDLYKKENVFILNMDEIESLPEFIRTPFCNISDDILQKHTIECFVDRLITNK